MAEPPRRTAVLHIGPMKTGSTAIQSWLRSNRELLAAAGVAVPLGRAAANLSRLAMIFNERRELTRPHDVTAETLTAELERLGPDTLTAVLSGELMSQSMRTEGITRLRAALAPFFDRWIVVVYLRRQDEIEASRLTTMLRRGSKRRRPSEPLDYAVILRRWSGVFGREAMRPRLFARGELVDGDVVADFVVAAGLPQLEGAQEAELRNTSLRPEAQLLLQRVGERFADDNGATFRALPGYRALNAALNQQFAGAGTLPVRAEAEQFVARVAESNERVRAEWFPERVRLFSDDFSRNPVDAPAEPSAAEQLEVALAAIVHLLGTGEETSREARREARRQRREPGPNAPGPGGEAAAGRQSGGGGKRKRERLGRKAAGPA